MTKRTNKKLYQIEMSTDGNHKVTVTIEDPGGTDAALAWAKGTYAKLVQSENPRPAATAMVSPEPPPICGIHHLPMVQVNGRKGAFWSCHEKNSDGSWCTYKPGRPA